MGATPTPTEVHDHLKRAVELAATIDRAAADELERAWPQEGEEDDG